MTVDEHVEVGTRVLVRTALLLLVVYVVYLIRDVVLLVALSALTAAALTPAIVRLGKFGLSRTVAVIIAYTTLLLVGVVLLSVIAPLFFAEIKEFLQNWPEYAKRLDIFMSGLQAYAAGIGFEFSKDQLIQNIGGNVTTWFSQIFSTTINAFRGFIHFVGYFFLALYLSLEERGIEKFLLLFTPRHYHHQALSIARRMQMKVSQWLFGQILLMIIAFVIYYIGLSLLHVPYALAIALFGGLMEILPYVGPVLAAIPAIIIGLLASPVLGVSALIFYIVAHQAEAHIIAPQVMKHSAGLNPVALIIAILIGLELGGPLGITLAVPITMVLSVFVEDLFERKSIENQ